jgi:short-subunit dehydrogenase
MTDLTYKTVLTGATGGLGQAMAVPLATVSSHMLLLGRNELVLNLLAKQLRLRHPHCEISTLAGDLNVSHSLQTAIGLCERMGTNLLVNNAGVNQFGAAQSVMGIDLERIIQTNLIAPMQFTSALLPTLLQHKTAQIIQVGSIFGYIGYPGNAVYCASKFGLRGYAQALSRELSDTGVRVKYFAPRATNTKMNEGVIEELNAALKVKQDSPQFVAAELIRFLGLNRFELKLGFPEKLFVFLNQILPAITDKALRGQLPVIKKYF